MNTTNNQFDIASYKAIVKNFPPISWQEYCREEDEVVRQDIAAKNRILQTDAYNRTMQHIRWEKWDVEEVFTLTLRKNAGEWYNIIYWIKKQLKAIFETPITQHELDFAKAFYADQKARGGNHFFDAHMWQDIIDNHWGKIPLHIKSVADGTALKAWEPVLWVKGKGELAARFEPLFTRISYETCVASDYFEITKLMHQWRIAEVIYADEFWARSAINWQQHFAAAEAGIVGWWLQATSSDVTAAVYPQLRTSWTVAHRFLAAYPTEDDAFIDAIEKTDKITLLVDLIDSYQWIDKAIALKKKYRHTWKKIGIRLDSWDLLNQALYALKKYAEEWMLDPTMDKIIIADISSIQQIKEIEDTISAAWYNPRDFIYYGLGELLIGKDKWRSRVSAADKLTWTNGRNTGKRSDDAGKRPIPWILNIEVRDTERVIVQDHEPEQGKRLLQTVYENWNLHYDTNGLRYIDTARRHLLENFTDIEKPTVLSAETEKAVVEVNKWFDTQSTHTTAQV